MVSRREYGTSGATLPVLGIGCWSFGGGDYWGPQDQQDVNAVISAALEQGVNYFDTAEAYNDGRSEEALGTALKGRRQMAILGTKVSPAHAQPSALRQHCEASLRRLQCDQIDLYMVHWPITDSSVEDAFATLEALKTEGKVGAIGLSNFGVRQMGEVQRLGVNVVVNQVCYNLLSRAIEVEIAPYCPANQIGILAYMPFLQGLLTGKYHSAEEMPSSRTRTRHFRGDRPGSRHGENGFEEETFAILDGIRLVAQEYQIPMNQLALAWILHQPAVTCVLAGVRTPLQLEEARAGAGLALPTAAIQRLNALTDPLKEKMGPSPDYYQPGKNGRIW